MAAKETEKNVNATDRVEMLKIMAATAAKLKAEPKKTIMLPLHDEKESDVFVAINGSRYQIKRGEEVEVPESVYKVLMESQKMDQLALKRSRALSEGFQKKLKDV